VSEVYATLLYYHDNRQEFEQLRQEREERIEDVESEITRPDDVDIPREG